MRTPPVDELLALAFDRAARRSDAAESRDDVPAALLAFAARVVGAGRRALATPACPPALLRRAAEIADGAPAPRSLRAALALVFDSFAGAAPAMRGGARSRFLRYEGGGVGLDLEVAGGEEGSVRVRGTLDGVAGDVSVRCERAGKAVGEAPVRAGGAFAVEAPAGQGPLAFSVRGPRGKTLLSVRIPR
jgi:hypothetical protein